MGVGASMWVAFIAWSVTAVDSPVLTPRLGAVLLEAGGRAPDAERAAPDALRLDFDADPATLRASDVEASEGRADDRDLTEEPTSAAPSRVARVLANPPVQLMVGLFSRGVRVNAGREEPPLAPLSVALRTKKAGAAFSLSLAF